MRRWAIASLLLAVVLVGASSGTMAAMQAKQQPLSISYHGQSFYILTTGKGTKIAFDPHTIPEYGRTEGLKADIILISHNHNDHTRVQALENFAKAKVIRGLKGTSLKADWNPVSE